MAEELDFTERGLSRSELLKLAAAAGGAALLGTRVGAAGAALSRLGAESGRLQVLDWVGYGYDGGQTMFTQYVKRYPQNKPQFTVMNNEADALGKITSHAVNPDLFRPYVGWVKYFAKSGLVQPWDTTQISNFKSLNPFMVKAGQYQGKQYGIPADWGFDAILYRTDKVHPKSDSFSLLFDDRYKGKITWYDDGVEMFTLVGYLMGFKDPYNQTDAQLKQAQDFLKSKRHLVRNIWSSEASMDTDFASGNVWIAYAWPADYWAMKGKGLKVRYMFPKEKPISWVGMFMLLKNTPRPAPRARVRGRLELGQVGEVARGQLRLRQCEHEGAPIVERPAEGPQARESESGGGAERAPRPRRPAARPVHQAVGAGEGLLTAA